MTNPLSKIQNFPEADARLTASPVIKDDIKIGLDALDQEIANALQKLTHRQRKFVQEYATGKSGVRAATDSGYSEHTACSIANENLRKPDVRQAVALLGYRYELETGLSGRWKRAALAEIYRRAMVQIPPDLSAAIASVGLLAKIDGNLAPQIIELRETVVDKIERAKARVDAMLAHDGSGTSDQPRANGENTI